MPRYARSLAAASAVTLLLTLLGCHTPGEQAERFAVGEIMLHSRFATNLRALSMPGGRLSGTENARQAEEFIAAQTRSYGLKNVRFHAFEMHCWLSVMTRASCRLMPMRSAKLMGAAPVPPSAPSIWMKSGPSSWPCR